MILVQNIAALYIYLLTHSLTSRSIIYVQIVPILDVRGNYQNNFEIEVLRRNELFIIIIDHHVW